MKTLLKMPDTLFTELDAHLLPPDGMREEAAFLFVSARRSEDHISFEVVESAKLASGEFDSQEGDYLELKDETRAHLIKRAHDLGASLVEMHSHPGPPWPAAFSPADRLGLQETVPHMWWRLPKRPYLAIVVAPTGFDALVWLDNPKISHSLDGILAGDRLLRSPPGPPYHQGLYSRNAGIIDFGPCSRWRMKSPASIRAEAYLRAGTRWIVTRFLPSESP